MNVAIVSEREGGDMSVQVLDEYEVARRIPMSRAEYDALPESEERFEWADGEAIELIAPIPSHAEAVIRVGAAFVNAFPELRTLGGAALNMPSSVRIPDLLVVPSYPLNSKRITEPALVAVEILSPSTWREDLNRKPREYGEFGVQQYWTVDLVQPQIVIRENTNGEWTITQVLTPDNPTADIPISNYGTVHLDLNQIVRS